MVFPGFVFTVFIQLFLLFHYAATLSSLKQILHCNLHDDLFQDLCLECEKTHILNQKATSCILRSDFRIQINCMQISDFGECMRCHCGYVLSEFLGECVIAPSQLIGCEIVARDNICTRPKSDYLLLKLANGEISLEFARGSHCEIFDKANDSCIQCHSGYKYEYQSNQCLRNIQRIFNEYFSFFSIDGELSSRSLQFTAKFNGVYPKIQDCLVYTTNKDNLILQCEECDAGRSLNENKTQCQKSTVDFCKISRKHSEQEGQIICTECIDNDNFFLSSNEFNQQFCLPRQLLDPTTKCLDYFVDIPNCSQCSKGLFLTETGCSLEPLDSKEQGYYSYTPENQESQDSQENCEYWLNDNFCGSCKKGMIPNIKGTCQRVFDLNCLIVKENSSSCERCIPLMYFSKTENKCIFIDESSMCIHSLGESNTCEICISHHYLYLGRFCVAIDILFCSYSDGKENKCAICNNKYFLNEQFSCEKITEFEACSFSDGVSNKCIKCNRFYIQDEQGKCISQVRAVNHQCNHPFFYLEDIQNEQDLSDSSITPLCVKYTFRGQENCFRFHPHKNLCMECQSGYYLSSGECEKLAGCYSSDGINAHCDYYKYAQFFFDDAKKIYLLEQTCKDTVEQHCVFCLYDDLNYGIPVTEIVTPSSSQQITQTLERCARFGDVSHLGVFPYCLRLIFTDNHLKCSLCINLWYLDENNSCQHFVEGFGCEISDGISQKCQICSKQYKLNPLNNICEIDTSQLLPIPFCIKQLGIQCMQCENLYYIEFKFCMPLLDPDCESSNGIDDICQLCKNGQLLLQQQNSLYFPPLTICNSLLCKSTDPLTGSCLECHLGYILIQPAEKNPKIPLSQCLQKKEKCESFYLSQQCQKCEKGYYLDRKVINFSVCLRIFIDNCIGMDLYGQKCSQCKAGYDLLQSGLCFKQTRCLRFENAICLECAKEFYLKDGICVQIKNCQVQVGHKCQLCSSKYWLSSRQHDKQISKQLDNLGKYNINYDKASDSSSTADNCYLIPHCIESNGLTKSCKSCEIGFVLRNEVCIIDFLEQVGTTTTTKNCVSYNEDSQCVKCQNLFFLAEQKCVPISPSSNCQQNNGIKQTCEVCSQDGFKLNINIENMKSQEQEDSFMCLRIQNCVISNGIDRCIVCEDNHIVNTSGQCSLLDNESKILNCYEMSYERTPNKENQLIYYQKNNLKKRITSNIPNNNTPELFCKQCNNLFYLSSDQLQCIPLSPQKVKHCHFSNGRHNSCSICQYGFLLQIDSPINQDNFCVRKPKKQSKRLLNQGCQGFSVSDMGFCVKCFETFFLNQKNGSCHPRSEHFLRKCLRFNPTEDECEICASGFKMKEFRSMNRTMKICLKLDVREEIENCTEYSPGTNKCILCIKRYQYDAIEYVLDEDNNRCIDVLHLMCRTIDRTKLACIDHFIPNCEKTVSFKCIQCDNGFYLSKREKGYEMPQQLSESISCIKHALIRNCQIYSQEQQDTCDFCEPYFSLVADNNQDQCVAITLSHCRHAKGTTCIQCEDSRFGLDKNSGTCVENQIVKCLEFTQDRISNTQVCLKCQRNYILSNNKTECIWRLPEMNCKNSISLSEENQVCSECKEGYFLNINGDCLRINSFCRIANCLEYSKEQSVADAMICKQCISNYVLDQQSQVCLPLDPQSNINNEIQEDLHDVNKSNSKNSSKDEIKQEQQDSFSHFILLVVCLAIVLVLIFLINQIIRILKSQRSSNHEDCQVEKVIFKHTKESHIDVNIEIPDVESVKNQSKDANHNEEDSNMSFENQNEWIS